MPEIRESPELDAAHITGANTLRKRQGASGAIPFDNPVTGQPIKRMLVRKTSVRILTKTDLTREIVAKGRTKTTDQIRAREHIGLKHSHRPPTALDVHLFVHHLKRSPFSIRPWG